MDIYDLLNICEHFAKKKQVCIEQKISTTAGTLKVSGIFHLSFL